MNSLDKDYLQGAIDVIDILMSNNVFNDSCIENVKFYKESLICLVGILEEKNED